MLGVLIALTIHRCFVDESATSFSCATQMPHALFFVKLPAICYSNIYYATLQHVVTTALHMLSFCCMLAFSGMKIYGILR